MLTNGAIAAAVVVDAVVRLLPGVLGDDQSAIEGYLQRTGTAGLLEGPQYTRPAVYREHAVPPVLLSGNHAAIAKWRREQALCIAPVNDARTYCGMARPRQETKTNWQTSG